MKIKPTDANLKAFNDGLKAALADDGRIGPNDAPALKKLAKAAGMPALEGVIDRFKADYVPPARHDHNPGSGYATQVVHFKPGPGGGFNNQHLDLVLGRPEGSGSSAGSLHVVSLGHGGQITLKLGREVQKGLKVFENGFGPNGNAVNPEAARVEVSTDGKKWHELKGTAGNKTVQMNDQNGIDVRTSAAGGDVFDFAGSGLKAGTPVQFVRITDLSKGTGGVGGTAGFDLDAVYGF